MRRRSPGLVTNEAPLGLRRQVVGTRVGRVVVRAGRRQGTTATVLLHGAAGSWTTWTPLVVASDRLGRPLHDLVIPDLRGWGESGAVAPEMDAAALAASVAECARALGYERWDVVGHSLGGVVALELGALEPRATRSVVLVSGSGAGVVDAIRRPVRGSLGLPGFAGMLLAMRILVGLGTVAPPLLRALRRTGLLRVFARPLFARPSVVDRTVVDALADEIRPRSFIAAARALADYDLTRWRSVVAPVVMIRGRADVFAGRRDTEVFARLLRSFAEHRVADAGHFAHIERPEAVLDVVQSAASRPERRTRITVAA